MHLSTLIKSAEFSLSDTIKGINIPKAVSDLKVNPYSESGGAAIGGLGGAALGGLGGIIKTLVDDEDDGVISALKKALGGAAMGGGLGAVAGAGTSYLTRRNLVDAIPATHKGDDAAKQRRRDGANDILKNFTVPVGSYLDQARGNIDQKTYDQAVNKTNSQEGLMSMLAPILVRHAQAQSQNPRP